MKGLRAYIRALAAATLLTGCACAPQPQPSRPALWRVEDRQGHAGWLFGTIHSSPEPLAWQTPEVRSALRGSRTIMVEVGNLADEAAVGAVFARLAQASGRPPLAQRVPASARPALAALEDKAGLRDHDFAGMDTWAAALTLANAGTDSDHIRNGVDRAVVALADGRPVVELEGAEGQLALFDALPEQEQRDLLVEVIREAAGPDQDLSADWRRGDMRAIERETRAGMLADPQLRRVLLTDRNLRWTARIANVVTNGGQPFVAVGAAHMAGPEGLPGLLERRGFRVTRVQ